MTTLTDAEIANVAEAALAAGPQPYADYHGDAYPAYLAEWPEHLVAVDARLVDMADDPVAFIADEIRAQP